MSDEDRSRILRMVAEGKLSPEDAANLLEAVESEPEEPRRAEMPPPGNRFPRRRTRHVVIHIREGGDNKVNLRIPISLTRAAGKFIPRQAQGYLNRYEINLHDLLEDIADTEGGTILEIKEGENKVLIAVE